MTPTIVSSPCGSFNGIHTQEAAGDRYQGALPRLHRAGPGNLIEKMPSGERWIDEIKFDGYRVQVHVVNER